MQDESRLAIRLADATVEMPLRGVSAHHVHHDERIISRGGRLYMRALSGITLDVRRGERLGILGGNGSGKTTLLRLMGGMVPLDSGTVEVNGTVRSLITIAAGTIPALTGRQNARLRHALLELRRIEPDDYLADVAEFSDLGDFFDLPVGTYSPGMLSRLQFAMSTVEPADILILDEWLGVADRSFHEKARARLMSLIESSDAFILASHDEYLLNEITDRRVILDRGRIVSDSSPPRTDPPR